VAACWISDFRVHGVEGLRVVNASVFPRIPGFFIVSAVYGIGEKAADAIPGSRL
jgi:choline dehydrogenase